MEKMTQELAEMEAGWKRALADYKNLQNRITEETEYVRLFSNEILIQNLLPVLDMIEMSCEHFEDPSLKMIKKEFEDVLKGTGVTEVEVDGKKFDSQKMEALEMVEGEKDKVIKIGRKGYLLNGKLIRPAQVFVGRGKE